MPYTRPRGSGVPGFGVRGPSRIACDVGPHRVEALVVGPAEHPYSSSLSSPGPCSRSPTYAANERMTASCITRSSSTSRDRKRSATTRIRTTRAAPPWHYALVPAEASFTVACTPRIGEAPGPFPGSGRRPCRHRLTTLHSEEPVFPPTLYSHRTNSLRGCAGARVGP
jgi:hypothetical protein